MDKNELKKILDDHKLWLSSKGGARADLRHAYLEGADLKSANLRYANLRYANLYRANLRSADLEGADLRSADLRRADLEGADLRSANLRGADLRYADLRRADLYGAKINWQSHDLLGEILQRQASTLEQRSVAGVVSKSLDWCWKDFEREFSDAQKTWAVSVLKEYVHEDGDLPVVLKEVLHSRKENTDE